MDFRKKYSWSQILVQLLRGQRACRPADHLQHGQPEQNQVFVSMVNMVNMVNMVIIFNMVNLSKTSQNVFVNKIFWSLSIDDKLGIF